MSGDNLFISQPGTGSWADELVPANPTLDPFGRRRVSTPENLLDSKLTTGKQGLIYDELISGAATSLWDQYNSCVDMSVSPGGYVIRQTRQRLNYQAGKGQLFEMTGILEPQTGTQKRLGACTSRTSGDHDVIDGVCFETLEDVMYLSIYKDTVSGTPEVRRFPQSEWADKLDGTGPSGQTVDWSKTQIFVIDYQWLGVGTVRYGLNIDGETYYVATIHNSNRYSNVYMRSGNQCVHYEIRSTGGSGTMKHICSTVVSEGGQGFTGVYATLDLGIDLVTANELPTLILAARLQPTGFSAVVSQIKSYVLSTTNDSAKWMVLWNPIISGTPNWVDVPGNTLQTWNGTGAEKCTPIIAPDAGFFSSQERSSGDLINTNLRLGVSIDGEPDVFALAIQNVSGNANVTGGLQVLQQT